MEHAESPEPAGQIAPTPVISTERQAVQDAFCALDRASFTRFCVFVLSITHDKGPYAPLNAATLAYLKTKEAEDRFGRKQEHP